MKIAAIIFLTFGFLSLIGAACKGDSVFGPIFCIALGGFFFYKFLEKREEEKENESNTQKRQSVSDQKCDATCNNIRGAIESEPISPHKKSLIDVQTEMTLEQREAAVCLLIFFSGFNENPSAEIPMRVLGQSLLFFGIPDTREYITEITSKFSDSEELINTVITIESVPAKEYLLLSCYDLIKNCDKEEAFGILYNIANDMGYNNSKLMNLIIAYS